MSFVRTSKGNQFTQFTLEIDVKTRKELEILIRTLSVNILEAETTDCDIMKYNNFLLCIDDVSRKALTPSEIENLNLNYLDKIKNQLLKLR